jgi:putative spermidine/putrescine transport system ATP-binding protein
MDEPLGALDKKLREEMQVEIKHIHDRLGITMVFVTHDQDEALTMSDRIAVFSQGRIQQIGKPTHIYENPANEFVARFIGDTNILRATFAAQEGGVVTVRLPGGQTLRATLAGPLADGQDCLLSIRPERVNVNSLVEGRNHLTGHLTETIYHGAMARLIFALPGGGALTAQVLAGNPILSLSPDTEATLVFAPADVRAFAATNGGPHA